MPALVLIMMLPPPAPATVLTKGQKFRQYREDAWNKRKRSSDTGHGRRKPSRWSCNLSRFWRQELSVPNLRSESFSWERWREIELWTRGRKSWSIWILSLTESWWHSPCYPIRAGMQPPLCHLYQFPPVSTSTYQHSSTLYTLPSHVLSMPSSIVKSWLKCSLLKDLSWALLSNFAISASHSLSQCSEFKKIIIVLITIWNYLFTYMVIAWLSH